MKRFLIKLSLMVLPIVCAIVYYAVKVEPNRNGDLGAIGFIPFDWGYHTYLKSLKSDSLYEEKIDYLDFENANCDSAVLVIGDSFAEQGQAGFANCLASQYPGFKIYNFMSGDDVVVKYQQFINRLIDGRPLPRVVILESIERSMAGRLSAISMDFKPEFEKEKPQVSNPAKAAKKKKAKKKNKFKAITQSIGKSIEESKDELKDLLLYSQEYLKKRTGAVENPTKHLDLKMDLFSCKGEEDDLYFYYDDLATVEENDVETAKQNLDSLIHLAEQKGIRFVFMVAADKYDLYKDFAVNDTYKAKGQLDYFSEFNSNNCFLNCKELLYPHLQNGEKDIYKCYDTHWTLFAAQYAAEGIKMKLDKQKK